MTKGVVVIVAAIGVIPVEVPIGPGLDYQLDFNRKFEETYPRTSISFASI